MGDPALAAAFAQDIVLLKQAGVNPIVVHGGGPQIAGMLKRLQLKSEFVHGLRVTDKPTVEVVEMVLAGLINKDIVTAINRQGGKAVGISGKDANLMIARKITEMPDPESNLMQAVDIGYVGDPAEINPHIVEVISASDLIPVIAPVAISREGETLNVNADTFASALAARMKAKRLLLLTDVAGVLDKDGKLIAAAYDRGGAQADPRGRHHRRHDPQDRRLHRGGGGRRRGRGGHRRARAALRAAGALHRARRRHARHPQGEEGRMSSNSAQRLPSPSARGRGSGEGQPQCRRSSAPHPIPLPAEGGERTRRARSAARLRATRVWIFDLDNTLYPADCNLFAQVDQKMGEFISRYLGVPFVYARHLQKTYYRQFGTTLCGLMKVHRMDPKPFLDYVHDLDLTVVQEHPELAAAIDRLPGRKLIFTNGSRAHAERVAGKLGVLQCFEGIFDIGDCRLRAEAHGRAATITSAACMASRRRRRPCSRTCRTTCEAPHALGMTTVLVRSDANYDHPVQQMIRAWVEPPEHVHHMTHDLAGFLEGVRPLSAAVEANSQPMAKGV